MIHSFTKNRIKFFSIHFVYLSRFLARLNVIKVCIINTSIVVWRTNAPHSLILEPLIPRAVWGDYETFMRGSLAQGSTAQGVVFESLYPQPSSSFFSAFCSCWKGRSPLSFLILHPCLPRLYGLSPLIEP